MTEAGSDDAHPAWSVRSATEADLPAITDLHVAVQALHREAEPELYKPAARSSIEPMVRARLSADDHAYLVATTEGGDVVGYALSVLRRRAETPLTRAATFVELDEISVADSHQRRGVARALCDAAARRAKTQGATTLRITVRHVNAAAQAAYEALGYHPTQHRLELKLGERV